MNDQSLCWLLLGAPTTLQRRACMILLSHIILHIFAHIHQPCCHQYSVSASFSQGETDYSLFSIYRVKRVIITYYRYLQPTRVLSHMHYETPIFGFDNGIQALQINVDKAQNLGTGVLGSTYRHDER